MTRLQRSWELLKSSLRAINENRKLLVFPLLIVGFFILIVLFFLLTAVIATTDSSYVGPVYWPLKIATYWPSRLSRLMWNPVWENPNWQPGFGRLPGFNPAFMSVLACIYLISMFLSTFFNVAFFNEILNALNGRPVSIAGGFRFALSRLKAIFMWSLFAGAVGLIIKGLEQRVGIIGKFIVGLIGIAWSVAAVFAIPVIVREQDNANPVRILQSSARLIKKTWGESLIGYIGLSFIAGLLGIGVFLLFMPAIALGDKLNNYWLTGFGVALFIIIFVSLMILLNVANQIYRAALFIYATEGVVPGPFQKDQMDMAWKIKSGRKSVE